MKHLITIAALAIPLSACKQLQVCTPNETRCSGSFVEVCDANGWWTPATDCASVAGGDDPAWMCAPVPEDELGPASHACLPPGAAAQSEGE